MIALHYKLNSYTDYLAQMAEVFQTGVNGDKLEIPPQFGRGYFKVIRLDNGLEALVYDFALKENMELVREREEREYYTLILDEVNNTTGFSVSIDRDEMHDSAVRQEFLYMTSFLYDVHYILHRNVHLKGVRVLLTEAWMRQYLQLDEKENVLEKYINLKTAGILYKPVDETLRKLLHEIVLDSDIPRLFYYNKILRIVEIFFEWLYDEMKVMADKSGINRQDIEVTQKIESILTNDITQPPPTIKELAREVAMSESKLKKIFKAVYGLPPYEYYQKQRMQKARVMLLSGDYSVKDIGYTLGYANLSNFTLAFKKIFGQLPSEVLRSTK